ncbi:hypothetical protein KP509_15G015300 [Ceratopteris richardii]|uniref:ADP-ribosyl cyclase/cyclic ADP-ribose hydrolase n=1 Tax=Ceratopteris richardii TaxID=49495 RepID=A0A8T2T259_CERRI|nr:hypothetical protein KP509_15G015300 [Ceratopteris richardii]
MRGIYDVFICHRGPDTKRNIVSVLRGMLNSKGITCFVEYKLEEGAEIYSSIEDAIRGSKVHIILLSPDFAGSIWCLDEVVEILKAQGSSTSSTTTSTVIPVFCDVQTSTVRNQPKDSAYDLSKLRRSSSEEREIWSKALKDVSDIEGFDYDTKRTDTWEKVQEIVARVDDIL